LKSEDKIRTSTDWKYQKIKNGKTLIDADHIGPAAAAMLLWRRRHASQTWKKSDFFSF